MLRLETPTKHEARCRNAPSVMGHHHRLRGLDQSGKQTQAELLRDRT
jgi:hypothetical protein